MATDLDKLIVQLSADIKGYERAMTRASGIMNRQAREIENRARSMNKKLDSIMQRSASSFIAPLAAISTALSVREVARYADAWTVAQNKINAASQISGMQARSLEDLNKIADETRSGITETVDLYAKLMRSTAGVAKSEMEVAKATEIVNKAFKAGGAAASEQAAGILQLSQGLGSGTLQGDELRSVRENAPILAQAIADYYKVSIAGLKKLGEEGLITSEGVFKAILAAGPRIQAAYATTNATIQDGITRVSNAFTQYIGQTDSSLSASQRLVAGLNALADNFDRTADIVLRLAGVIAGALVGRSLLRMIAGLGLAGEQLTKFLGIMRSAVTMTGLSTALGGLTALAGPLGVVFGGAVTYAMFSYAASAQEAEERTDNLAKEMERLGLYTKPAAEGVDAVADALDNLSDREAQRRIKDLRLELEALKDTRLAAALQKAREGLGLEAGWLNFGDSGFEDVDAGALRRIRELGAAWESNKISARDFYQEALKIETVDLSKNAKALVAELIDIAAQASAGETSLSAMGGSVEMDAARAQLTAIKDQLLNIKDISDVDKGVVDGLVKIIDAAIETGNVADGTFEKLEEIAEAHTDVAGYIDRLMPLFGWLQSLAAAAAAARSEMASVAGAAGADSNTGRHASDRADREKEREDQAYIAEQRRRNALSKEGKAIEDEVNRILKERPGLLKSQAEMLARENIAADEARRGGGKKGGGNKAAERFDDAILKEIEGMKAETTALNSLTGAQVGYGKSVERARKEAELLQELQNKGLKVTPELRARVSELASEWEKAASANEEANARLERLEAIGQSVADSLSQAFEKAFTDPQGALKDLGKELAMIAIKMQLARLLPGVFGASGIGPLNFASGGMVRGPGTGTSDSIPARLSNGEFVVNAAATARNRALLEAINGGKALALANGGYVGTPSIPTVSRAGGGLTFQLVDQRPAGSPDMSVQQQRQRGPNGREMVVAVVKEEWSRGAFDKPMRGRQGVGPQKLVR